MIPSALLLPPMLLGLVLLKGQVTAKPTLAFTPAPGSPVSVGSRPIGLALADFNGDGKPDIVTANAAGRSVSILLGDGGGRFHPAAGSPFPVAIDAHLVAAGDLNGDRKADLALTEHDSYRVTVLLGDGRGGFAPAPGSPFAASKEEKPHNHGLALADVNSDARLDVLACIHNHQGVSVLLGDGHGSFAPAPASPLTVGRGPYPLLASDLNGDGATDIATPNIFDGTVTVLLGNGKGAFTPAPGSPYRVEPRPYQLAAGDFDGNGRPDLAVAHDDISLVVILLAAGRGGWTRSHGPPLDLGRPVYSMVAADLDGDGRAELLAGEPAGTRVALFRPDREGRFPTADSRVLDVGRSPNALAAFDVNGDKKLDIVTANEKDGTVSILLRQ